MRYLSDGTWPIPSPTVADTIDSEVKRIIDECYQKAKDIIKQYDYVLHACADLLIEKEKISQSEFEALFTPVQ